MDSEMDSPKKQGNNGNVPLSDIFFITLRHWPWILLSVAICVGLAYVYLLRTPLVYTRSAEIMVKDDTKGQSVGVDEFSDMGLFKNKTNIENEISSLKSKDLMEEVVRRLGLDINYYRDGQFHKEVCYGPTLPVKIEIIDFPDEGTASFDLKVDEKGVVTIKDIKGPDGNSFSKTYTGHLNGIIPTAIGKIVVNQTDAYQQGETIELNITKIPLSVARESYNKRLAVSISDDKGTVINLTLTDQSTKRADEVLNTLIAVYNENWIQDKNKVAVSTSKFIDERLNVIEGELGNVDSDISSYKSANLIPDVNEAATMYMNQRREDEAKILSLNNQLSVARFVRNYLSQETTRGQLIPANSGLTNSAISTQIDAYNEKLLQRNALAANSSAQNPLVAQLDEQLIAQRHAIIKAIDNEIVGLNTQMQTMHGNQAEVTAKLQSNPTQAKQLLSVERQQKVKESLYLFLLQKREENELSQAFTAYNTRIINRPGPSGTPPTPNQRNILTIAFLIGLIIPFGYTYIKVTLNTKIRGRKDIEDLTPPFLGEIPLNGDNREKNALGLTKQVNAIVVKAGKRNVINEAFRVLRTNLEFMKIHKDSADVVSITSFNAGSGKSFISINLSIALSLKKQRVLVIDGDMRHGTASSYIDSPKKGLADVLNGAIDNVHDAIVVDKENKYFSVLPVGTVPPNPTELLETGKFQELLENLRKEYDYIVIDCPPIEIVADTQIIDKQSDRTLFVLRAGIFERSMLPEIDKLYEEKKFKNMAIILNGTTSSQGLYGYSHSYRYGYGYGYGYGYNYGSDNQKKGIISKLLKK